MAYELVSDERCHILRLVSADGQNRLTRQLVRELSSEIERLKSNHKPLIISGNDQFFSAGADLNEVSKLTAPDAFAFAKEGQRLMNAIAFFPAITIAAISGFCFGGGLDLALSCCMRIASPSAIFGHRGVALGLITGWGGTQRLPRTINRAKALSLFLQAKKVDAASARACGLVYEVHADPLSRALQLVLRV